MVCNVLQVVHLIGGTRGVETVAAELHRAFTKCRIDAGVLTTGVGQDLVAGKIDILLPWTGRLSYKGSALSRRVGRTICLLLFALVATIKVRRLRKMESPPVILSHGEVLCKGTFFIAHNVTKESIKVRAKNSDYKWALNPVTYYLLFRDWFMLSHSRHRHIFAVSDVIKQELIKNYRVPDQTITVIPNGVDITKYTAIKRDPIRFRREFGIPESSFIALFVGHEFERKGLRFVIEALPHCPETSLIVVGGDCPKKYKKIASDIGVENRVHFIGVRSDLDYIFSSSDCFVFPTAYEPFGLVCIEALASELPLLATWTGGIKMFLRDGENGLIIRRDGADIGSKIAMISSDAALRERIRVQARVTSERFSWDNIGKRYISEIQRLSNVDY